MLLLLSIRVGIMCSNTYVTHHAKLRRFSKIFMSSFITNSDRAESGVGGGGGMMSHVSNPNIDKVMTMLKV